MESEKTKRSLIARLDKDIATVSELYETWDQMRGILKSQPNNVEKQILDWWEKLVPLNNKVLKVYRAKKQELELAFDPSELTLLSSEGFPNVAVYKLNELLGKLKTLALALAELRDRKERELEEEGEVEQKRTLSVADIISDPRIGISKAWFSILKEKIPLPSSDTTKDHGEAWTDGESIIQKIIEYRKENPRKPPQKTKQQLKDTRAKKR